MGQGSGRELTEGSPRFLGSWRDHDRGPEREPEYEPEHRPKGNSSSPISGKHIQGLDAEVTSNGAPR